MDTAGNGEDSRDITPSDLSSLTLQEASLSDITPTTTPSVASSTVPSGTATPSDDSIPPHRSHDRRNNLKRSDPFKFGSRYLEQGDDVFEFNAWDNVETDDTYKEFAEVQYAKQRESPVSDFDKHRFNSDPAKWWNLFYRNNTANFFKNRKWLQNEFPVLSTVTQPDSPPTTLLEVGAGAGNTAFPILSHNRNPKLKIHACDFSKNAVEVIRADSQYNEEYIRADVWDIAGTGEAALPPGLKEGSVDIVMMIFIFSALSPRQWNQAVKNIFKVLKPGGQVLFRDYGRGDLAQVRFKKGRYLEENFYIRGDGTRVYFFEKEELQQIWEHGCLPDEEQAEGEQDTDKPSTTPSAFFETANLGIDRRLLVNRKRQLKMYRCWIQGRFLKPIESSST
ncbi:putative actin-binding protein ABP140 [Xylona heveae TC161]|uniref:tRNA N(3)-methylcytidine methyltransferase n=1 Tax=Xylona heveae (strain CBS 132557 / TC161) TaxID=1328760 RepID=A0A165IF56_XYLHT|nr:putative actin-binding protein ABP140 [Xylona heveae TC161]KZF24810.1 putative actin-binding protein ABP140 [Xylona heveae TC161]